MKKNIIYSLLLLLVFAINLNAQNDFLVLGRNGKVQTFDASANKWVDVKAGDALDKNSRIMLKENSYVSFYHTSGKHIELNRAGTFNLANLVRDASNGDKAFLEKFWSFLIGKFSDQNNALKNNPHRQNMDSVGGQDRGFALKIRAPKKVHYIKPEVIFSWFKVNGIKEYDFHIKDKYDRDVFSKTVTDTFIRLDLSKLNLTKDSNYLWFYKLPNVSVFNTSNEGTFLLLSGKSADMIKDTANILLKHLGDDKSSVSKIVLASYYEQNHMINEAMKLYLDAMKLAPEVDDYKKIYDDFVRRSFLNEND